MADTTPLFTKLVQAQLIAQRQGWKRPRDPRRVASRAVQRAGVDAFFSEQARAMRACGHWARQVLFSEKGVAMLQFVGFPGQQGTYGRNVSGIYVAVDQAGAITVSLDANNADLVQIRHFAPEWFNRTALINAYSGFVSAVMQQALSRAG